MLKKATPRKMIAQSACCFLETMKIMTTDIRSEKASYLEWLIQKLNDKTALIGIVGLGYFGLPLLLRYVEAGYRVLGFDMAPEKVIKLHRGETYIKHISSAAIGSTRRGFEATTDFSRTRDADALTLCISNAAERAPGTRLKHFVINTTESLVPC